jgi:uncharacterized damage-inducible protein DinB
MSLNFVDPRMDPPPRAAERDMLESWLNFHRATLWGKCDGLDDEQRKRRPIVTSLMSLHGLVRHMADVERNWFRRPFTTGSAATPILYPGDSAWAPLGDADWAGDTVKWRIEVEHSRQTARAHGLEDSGTAVRGGQCSEFSLRWIYNHMIEEYARHNGHADLLRELVDGAVGV